MTNLEFIESRLNIVKSKIKICKENIEINKDEYKDMIFTTDLEILEKQEKILEQIKTDLEAWEIVKHKGVDMIIFMIYDGNLEKYNDYVKSSLENECDYEKCLLTQYDCEKLKKALEVDDVKN